jgi:serine/threonine protein phosphatase 1
MRVGEASTPDGTRVYAIGDVHGCDAMLADMHSLIAADLAANRAGDHRIIHIGDYVDRGPDSAAVLTRLAAMQATDPRVICLKGNHDELLADVLTGSASAAGVFLANGGDATLASYGVETGGLPMWRDEAADLTRQLADRMPAGDRRFLDALRVSALVGDYFFCHAGIRPGVPLDRQTPRDLLWIREPFLSDGRDHGAVVVHGHTPVGAPDVRTNRINIDTGAVYGGPLTCIVLEGSAYRFLTVGPA